MQHNDLHNNFTELIHKYLSGNADDAEVRRLEDWVLASPENKRQFQTSKKLWQATRQVRQAENNQTDAAWKAVSGKLFDEPKVVKMKPRNNRRIFMRLAAALAFLAAAGLWIFTGSPVEQPMAAKTTDNVENLELPDGSIVVLNRASELAYSPSSDKKERKVTLTGDAFFDIKKDKSRPFIITAGAVEIEVLGTAFYVDSRQGASEIQVSVEHGSVAVRANGSEEILTAGEKAVFQKDNELLTKKANEDQNFDFLKTRSLKFENTPVSEMFFVLNRFYDANISIEPGSLENCRLTAVFKEKSLDAVIKIIEKTLDIQSKRTKNGIIFYGTCE